MPNATASAVASAGPVFYDMCSRRYVGFSRIVNMARFVLLQTEKIGELQALVDCWAPGSGFAAHWLRKARIEMDGECVVNYIALKECEQTGLISSENARAWGLAAYYARVEAMHARLGMRGPIGVSVAQQATINRLVVG
jgi:hypothetical protein